MGCGMDFLGWLDRRGCIPAGARVLDIGESCLLGATPGQIETFLERHGCTLSASERPATVETFAHRSNLMGHPTIPTLFLNELLDVTDLSYVSFDVVRTRKAEIFDLNIHHLAADKHGTFDLVLNFGTTEHLVNQYNAFNVMHDAARAGAYLFHQVPSTGYLNHGYFCYNALFFKELAEANDYEIADLWFYGPSGHENVLETNAPAFPNIYDPNKPMNNVEGFRKSGVTSCLINVLYRKKKDAPFRVGLEVKTAASSLLKSSYDSPYIARGERTSAGAAPQTRSGLWARILSNLRRPA